MQSKQQAKQPNKQISSPTQSQTQTPAALQEEALIDVAQRAMDAKLLPSPADIPLLQHTIGNRAVGRLVQQSSFISNPGFGTDLSQARVHTNSSIIQTNQISSVNTHIVQRAGEYIPEMSVKPDQATVNMGEIHTERLDILNTREAPSGTTFQWGGGVNKGAGHGLDFIDVTPPNRPHARMQVKAMAPGEHEINANFLHQVPGGPSVFTNGPLIPITVPTPSVIILQFRRDTTGAVNPLDEKKLKIGDTVILRMTFSNLRGPGSNLGSFSELSGPGMNSVLEKTQETWKSSTQLDMEFQAKAVGSANLNVKLKLGDMTEAQAFTATVEGHVERSKEEFLEKCGRVNTKIDLAERAARKWFLRLANAYGSAWKNHTDMLEGEADERLRQNEIITAALTFVSGGVGEVVGKSMQAAKAHDFIVGGIKDLAKYGVKTVAGAYIQPTSEGLSSFPDDPLSWQNSTQLRFTEEFLQATKVLDSWQEQAGNSNFYMDFDPVEAMEASLMIEGYRVSELPEVDTQREAKNFEKGFWTDWLIKYGYIVKKGKGGIADSGYKAIGNTSKKIKKHCELLGINVEQLVGIAEQNAEATADKLNDRFAPFYLLGNP